MSHLNSDQTISKDSDGSKSVGHETTDQVELDDNKIDNDIERIEMKTEVNSSNLTENPPEPEKLESDKDTEKINENSAENCEPSEKTEGIVQDGSEQMPSSNEGLTFFHEPYVTSFVRNYATRRIFSLRLCKTITPESAKIST